MSVKTRTSSKDDVIPSECRMRTVPPLPPPYPTYAGPHRPLSVRLKNACTPATHYGMYLVRGSTRGAAGCATDTHVVVTNVSKRGGGYGGEDDSCAMVYSSGNVAVPIMPGPYHVARESTKPYFNLGVLALKSYKAVYVGEDFSHELYGGDGILGDGDVVDFFQGNTILFHVTGSSFLVVGCGQITAFKLEPKDAFVAYVSNIDPESGQVVNFVVGERHCYLLGVLFVSAPLKTAMSAKAPFTATHLRSAATVVRGLAHHPDRGAPMRVLGVLKERA